MATRDITVSISQRSDTCANWQSVNPTLKLGEIGYDSTNKQLKIGDGTTAWNSLAYVDDSVVAMIESLQDKVEPSNTGTADQVLTKTSSGQEWQDKDGGAIISTTEPEGKENAVWINSSTGVIKYWNGTSWASAYGVFA
ncbi:MAG: hypothetical protein R3Y32_03410 [Bacillota bacterium]